MSAAPTNESLTNKLLQSPKLQNLTILVLFVVIFGLFALASPPDTFLSSSNLESIGLSASQLIILGAGVTFLLIAGGLDLSVGAIIVFSSVTAASIMAEATRQLDPSDRFGFSLWGPILAGAAAGLLVGALWGFFNGLVVVRTKIPPFIATLASSTVILGLAQVWTGGINVSGVPGELQSAFGLGRMFGLVPWPIVVAAIIVGVLWVILAHTRYGMRIYAIGANPEAARRAGIAVDRYTVSVYVLVGALAGIAGVIDVSRFTTATVGGYTMTALNVITAVVIGGTSLWGGRGGMGGTIIGALIPATLTSGFVILGMQPFWQNVAVGLVLMTAVSVDQYRRRRFSQT
ncbi:MAG TPA: ABC transporter permease [Candidatus Agrococcus pullicola]|uniref:ABC transporter permease n=1 Tax=Candidatus Agrococcus pullicola TaxID=2838429 RepID=A0A9D2C8N9_9MICO|nr:ABC transporter permease [Candidatus Agrococcus pullicola]